jgi:hypothetical protein
VLRSAIDLGIADTSVSQLALQAIDRVDDELLALGSLLVEVLRNILVDRRMHETEGEVLELPLQLPDAEPIGQGRIQFQRLARHRRAQRIGLDGVVTQGLRARGQAQQDDANVFDHRQQHLAQHLDLRLHFLRLLVVTFRRMSDETASDRSHAVQTRNAVHQMRNAAPELFLDQRQAMLLLRRQREEQRRQPRIGVELEPGNDQGHPQGVPPDAFATAQLALGIGRPGKLHRASNALAVSDRHSPSSRDCRECSKSP